MNIFISDLNNSKECTLVRLMHDTRVCNSEEFNVLKDRAVIQRDLNKRKELVNGDITMLSKDKCKVLLLGLNTPMQQYRLGTTLLGSSSAEKGPRIQAFLIQRLTKKGQKTDKFQLNIRKKKSETLAKHRSTLLRDTVVPPPPRNFPNLTRPGTA